jgi:hypothetical protein
MDVHIYEPWGDDKPLCINRLINFPQRLTTFMADGHNGAIANEQIIYSINPLIWINDSSTSN